MSWFKWVRRAVWIGIMVVVVWVVAWIFWPSRQPGEQELLNLIPADADAVVVQRDFADHWKALRGSALFHALKENSLLPARVEAESMTRRVVENAGLDLLGSSAIVFVPRDAGRVCVVAPVTPGTKWLWLRAKLFQLLPKSGFTIVTGQVQGQAISEIQLHQNHEVRLHFGRRGSLFAILFGGSAQEVADVLARRNGRLSAELLDALRSRPDAIQFGCWQRAAGNATWIVSRTNDNETRIELTLPKQRAVRLPWDATRGPRSMALIQKLFPDQGMMTFRGRASHWMTAWDNIVAWLGLSGNLYSEALQTRLKYGERLSHGVFPWSGAGDEIACVVAPAESDTPKPWLTIVGAARCWETNDMQVAFQQFIPSLGAALGVELPLRRSESQPAEYVVNMGGREQGHSELFRYRYADGLVIGSNSRQTLQKFDPGVFADQKLETVPPENQVWCKPSDIAPLLDALAVLAQVRGNTELARDLARPAAVMKTVDEFRLSVVIGQETIQYSLTIAAR